MSAAHLHSTVGASGASTHAHAFRRQHPIVPAVFFAGALVLSMAAFHPVLCALSLGGALAFSLICRGAWATATSLAWALPLVVLIALLNPFFSATGSTAVAQVAGFTLYAESLAYGVCMGLMLCSALIWMQNAAAIITMEDTMTLTSRVAPIVGVMMSMIARLIPRYLQRGHELAHIQAANTCARPSASSRLARASRRATTLVAWSMEDSLITADAMAARGWNAATPRTSYERYAFGTRDALYLTGIGVLLLCAAIGAWHVMQGFAFYPHITPVPLRAGMVAFALYMALPCIVEVGEVLAWRH